MNHFQEIESQLTHLLSIASLTNDELTEVQRFIDVGEYGIALETIAEIYFEEMKLASAEVIDLINSLAEKMSMDGASLTNRLVNSRNAG